MVQLNPGTDCELMFESAPISLWLEDYSARKVLFDSWRAQGAIDLFAHITQTPNLLRQQCAACLEVLNGNGNGDTLTMFAAQSQEELLGKLGQVFRDEMYGPFAEQWRDLWDGKTVQQREVVNYSLSGELMARVTA